jgi:hypothetical protein
LGAAKGGDSGDVWRLVGADVDGWCGRELGGLLGGMAREGGGFGSSEVAAGGFGEGGGWFRKGKVRGGCSWHRGFGRYVGPLQQCLACTRGKHAEPRLQ